MEKLRHIPAIDFLQKHRKFISLKNKSNLSIDLLTYWLQQIVARLRKQIIANDVNIDISNEKQLYNYIFQQLAHEIDQFVHKNVLQKVINATGVVIHTNLGRSRLSERALKQMEHVASSYSTLEYDVKTGKRGSRHSIVEDYIVQLTGAEAAIVVNNNAAAVYFILNALAEGLEVIVSRGELVEIGGSFRISEIMQLSDAHLVEVGATNKTNISDYKSAITEQTRMILKVHKSNFAIVGFTEDVSSYELVKLAKQEDVILYEDLGSGTLYDFARDQIGTEPTVQEQIAKGIDLISFSGDKLLGGPQAGIIVGKKQYIDQLKRHQLARVLRVDKFTLASLEATLKTYMAKKEKEEIPTVRDILLSDITVRNRARTFLEKVEQRGDQFKFHLKKGVSKVGGGTMPDVDLATYVVEATHESLTSSELAEALRHWKVPIIVRVKENTVQLDFRTVTDEELPVVVDAFLSIT